MFVYLRYSLQLDHIGRILRVTLILQVTEIFLLIAVFFTDVVIASDCHELALLLMAPAIETEISVFHFLKIYDWARYIVDIQKHIGHLFAVSP